MWSRTKEIVLLKKLSLLKKFIIGFALILILLVALAFVGYRSQSSIAARARISESINTISAQLALARFYGQEFVISRDSQHANNVHQALDKMQAEIANTEAAYEDETVRQQLLTMQARARDYEQSFEAFVALADAQSENAAKMDQKAQSALDLTSRIRDREKAHLEEIRKSSQLEILRKTALVDAAMEIYNTALEVKVSRVSLMANNMFSTMATWKNNNKKLDGQVKRLRSQLQTAENVKLADLILKRQKQYMDDVLVYLETETYEDLDSMIKSVKEFTRSISSLQFELRQQLDFFGEDTQILIDEKLAATQSVNTMANLLMTAQLNEKKVAGSHDPLVAAEVIDKLEGVYNANDVLKEKIDNQEIHKQIEPIMAAVSEYASAFTTTVELLNRQSEAQETMSAAAQEVDKTCEAARVDQKEKTNRQMARSNIVMLAGTLIAVVVGVLCAVASAFIVVRPVRSTAAMIKDIAQGDGDLTQRLSVNSRDEIGQMAGWFNSFISKLHDIVRNISRSFETVSTSANQLQTVSIQMDDSVRDMNEKSVAVAKAANEMNQKMNSIAASSEQAANDIGMVASAMDNMNETVAEIGQSSNKAGTVTRRAVEETRQASAKVDSLGSAAEQISKVTQVITDISDQTNLLALNATIEAARAGEAGKGFAVVANEIKELARQTAEATKGIKVEIEGIQLSTAETVSDISRIADVIGEVDEMVALIGAAVDKQTATTTEISKSVSQAAQGMGEVSENVAESSIFSGEIASEITEVSRIAGTLSENSALVNRSSSDLNTLSEDIIALIGEFKVDRSDDTGYTGSDNDEKLVPWNESYAFAIDEIDEQHKRLVDLINRLHSAMRNRSSQTVLASILDELIQYTEYHFQNEEEIMASAEYADLDAHKEVHRKLVGEVLAFKNRFTAGEATVSMEMMRFLKDWLLNHIHKVDRKYVPVVKSESA
jgi:hemerythrin-like metal-binding protein